MCGVTAASVSQRLEFQYGHPSEGPGAWSAFRSGPYRQRAMQDHVGRGGSPNALRPAGALPYLTTCETTNSQSMIAPERRRRWVSGYVTQRCFLEIPNEREQAARAHQAAMAEAVKARRTHPTDDHAKEKKSQEGRSKRRCKRHAALPRPLPPQHLKKPASKRSQAARCTRRLVTRFRQLKDMVAIITAATPDRPCSGRSLRP